MSWFKVDDKFHASEEVKSIPRGIRAGAIGLWTLAGSWSADHLKDGYVPGFMIEEIGATDEQALALVKAKLWRRSGKGFQFRNWEKWQPTREQVENNRKAERDRKAEYRAGKRGTTGQNPEGVPLGQTQVPNTPSRPDPTRPNNSSSGDNSPSKARAKKPDDGSQPVDKSVDNYQLALAATAARMSKEVGREVTLLESGVIVDWILDHAKGEVRMPKRYVMGTLTRDWAVWTRYVHDGVLPE